MDDGREAPAGPGITSPPWLAAGEIPRRPPLERDVRADVCIVGGGISGLTTAYLLARAGRSVVLLDDGPLAGGETGRTTAHLTSALDDRFSWIEKVHGEPGRGRRRRRDPPRLRRSAAPRAAQARALPEEDGTVHERSAVCPHLGCVVAWNVLEKSWDCPCHGSRFERQGRVVNGPANRDLEPAEEESD